MNIEIRKTGVLKAFLRDATLSQAEAHVRNGYPDLVVDYEVGLLTINEILGDPIETPEDITERAALPARRAEKEFQNVLLRGVAKVLFNHENRIRALEAKPSITMEQFTSALKTILGI